MLDRRSLYLSLIFCHQSTSITPALYWIFSKTGLMPTNVTTGLEKHSRRVCSQDQGRSAAKDRKFFCQGPGREEEKGRYCQELRRVWDFILCRPNNQPAPVSWMLEKTWNAWIREGNMFVPHSHSNSQGVSILTAACVRGEEPWASGTGTSTKVSPALCAGEKHLYYAWQQVSSSFAPEG